ncbi:protein roadkill-like [Planococcus citri]|uniref:protein roadkill-like n=1 Tax=Planococcus citri TaxID=170843 RepID=UPI0031F7DCC4
MSDLNASTNTPAFTKHPTCTKNWFHTSAKKFEHEFTWIIKDFKLQVPNMRNSRLKSSAFSAANDSREWVLEPWIGGQPDSIFLKLKRIPIETNSSSISGSFIASLINSEHQKCNSFQFQFSTGDQNHLDNMWCERFIKCSDLTNELLPEGELRIYFKIAYIIDTITLSNHFPLELVDGSNPVHDFEKLFNDDDSSDVIIDVNGKKYPAHKIILAARSPVFKAMFKHDMKESRQNCVEIKDTDEKIFQEILRYIYTGKVENLNDIALELVLVAEKYDLAPLKNACLSALGALLSVETVVKILVLADLNDAQCLKAQAIEYIRANLIKVIKSGGWNDLYSNQGLMKCLLDSDD